MEDSTESEASRSQHSEIKEEIMKEVKVREGRMRSSEIYPIEVAEENRENGEKMMFENKMTDTFPEMKKHMKLLIEKSH